MKLKSSTIQALGIFSFAISCVIISSCNEESQQKPVELEEITQDIEVDDSKNLFYSIPSPMELGQLLKRAGATYNNQLLNPAERASQYVGTSNKALNMGVYVADLSYATVSNQMQESIIYLNSTKLLSEDLGLKSFSTEMILEIEKNMENKDELMKLVSEAYQSSNESLTENDREIVSLLSIAGGWIEGIYLGTQIAKTTKENSGIIKMVAEQRFTLDNLILQMDSYKSNSAVLTLANELKEVQLIYDEEPISEANTIVKSESGSNLITIGGTSGFSLSKDQFLRITEKIEKTRTSIVEI
ncbi:MAG: hypothetical protein M3Q58_14400 [Bacteroidota bacterium]|nr:hypothetical protein [Bacteroidota bacterium]